MPKERYEGCFDSLRLMVEPSNTDRTIVAAESGQEKYIFADGKIYEDQNWRIKLHNMSGHRVAMVKYKGESGWPGVKCSNRRFLFRTGELRLCLRNDTDRQQRKCSTIDCNIAAHDDELRYCGIWNSYRYDSPNQIWDIEYEEDCVALAVVSDGTVDCFYGQRQHSIDPDFEALAKIANSDNVRYEVSGATWTVTYVCREDSPAEIVLYAEPEWMKSILDSLEEYLQNMGLSGFDDILHLIEVG